MKALSFNRILELARKKDRNLSRELNKLSGINGKMQGLTLLHHASARGYLDLVLLLIKKDAQVDAKEKTYGGRTALLWAVQNGHIKIVEYLLKNKADPNFKTSDGFTALDIACGEGRLKIAKLLIKHGADINAKVANGSVLHTACSYNRVGIAKLLIKQSAKPNAKDKNGKTPLFYAKKYKNKSIVRLLSETEK